LHKLRAARANANGDGGDAGESVGADGDAAPLMMKNLPANCRRRRQKISGQLFNRMLDAIKGDLFKKFH